MYLLFSGLRGSYRPPAQLTHGLEDNVTVLDLNDEADFDIPDTQAVLERFMTHMSKLADMSKLAEYGARTGSVKVQGPGKLLLLSYDKYILVICITYTIQIPCISNNFKLYIQKISIGYKLYIPGISQVYCAYKHFIYRDHAYTMYIK
jgi:hypothetical protein